LYGHTGIDVGTEREKSNSCFAKLENWLSIQKSTWFLHFETLLRTKI